MRTIMKAAASLMLVGGGAGGAARAAETISYNYDARGRLVKVTHSGTVNDGVVTRYAIDKADNRLSMTVSGAGSAPPADTSTARCVATVSIGGGYRVIPCIPAA